MNAAPLLVSFNSIDKYLEALSESSRDKYGEEIIRLYELHYPPVTSPYCLSVLFGYSLQFTYSLLTEQRKFYRNFNIRQGTKQRRISSPKVALKVIQKWFSHHLNVTVTFPHHIYGFVKNRSFIDAAKKHIGSKWVYSVDIKDFFQSITEERVIESLQYIGYRRESAETLAKLCCLDKRLAQGSPASPIISNIYMRDIDNKLLDIGEKLELVVTRYADDIVFSGNNSSIENLKNEIEKIFESSELELNTSKSYFADSERGQRLKVHGLLIKDDRVSLTKAYRNKIRAYKHMLNSGKVEDSDRSRIMGHLNFSQLVELQENI